MWVCWRRQTLLLEQLAVGVPAAHWSGIEPERQALEDGQIATDAAAWRKVAAPAVLAQRLQRY